MDPRYEKRETALKWDLQPVLLLSPAAVPNYLRLPLDPSSAPDLRMGNSKHGPTLVSYSLFRELS